MTNILLTHGYFLFEDEKEVRIMKPYPTLGLLYISAYLRRAGFAVEVFDSTFSSRDALFERLQNGPKSVLGIYTNLTTRGAILEITARAHAHGWIVVLGGPEAANYPQEYIQRGAHVVVIGEGEETLAELLPEIDKKGPHRLYGVRGTAFQNESGAVIMNPARPQIENLDSLPWPDRGQIDQARYVDVWRAHHGRGSVNLITARGCPYKCNWCSHAVFGFSHRRRSYVDCANELEHIQTSYHPDQVWYADDVFTIHHGWLHNYAAELKRRKLFLPFETISRADRMMNENVIRTLVEMGCYRIWIGSESGSQRILDAMERGVKVEQVEWASKMAKRFGIEVGMFLMWGYEDETIEDMQATIDLVKKCDPEQFLTTVSYPIMNTGYFRRIADRVVLNKSWDDSTDRDYAIRNRHSRTYYQHADRWLRKEVAAHRAFSADQAAAVTLNAEARAAKEAMLAVAHEVEA
ncbi:MAG TPA: radical SAM protein [Terriglobales bacterium]|nr:radical SAM protein [Terriglobales bacterium]